MAAKIQGELLETIRAITAEADSEALRAAYRARDIPRAEAVQDIDKRFRWDLFWRVQGWRYIPDGITDAHIDTALRTVVPPL